MNEVYADETISNDDKIKEYDLRLISHIILHESQLGKNGGKCLIDEILSFYNFERTCFPQNLVLSKQNAILLRQKNFHTKEKIKKMNKNFNWAHEIYLKLLFKVLILFPNIGFYLGKFTIS